MEHKGCGFFMPGHFRLVSMRNKLIIILAALITTLVVFNLIRITIGIYTGDIPVDYPLG